MYDAWIDDQKYALFPAEIRQIRVSHCLVFPCLLNDGLELFYLALGA